MSDDFGRDYLATRKARTQQAGDSLAAQWEKDIAAEAAPPPSPAVAPAAAPKAPEKKSPSAVSEGLKAVAGGAWDAVSNTASLIDDAATWLDNNFLDLRPSSATFGQWGGRNASATKLVAGELKPAGLGDMTKAPDFLSNQTDGGKMGRSVAQFLVPFLGATKAIRAGVPLVKTLGGAGRAVGTKLETSSATRAAVAGAATDFTAFDPHEKRLSNMLVELGDTVPALKNPVTEYLAANPNDSSAEGRFKNTLEGLGIGFAIDGLFKGVKAVRGHFADKGASEGKSALQVINDAYDQHVTDAASAMGKEAPQEFPLAQQIDLLTGVNKPGPNKWDKRLDVTAAVRGDGKQAAPAYEDLSQSTADSILQKGSADLRIAPDAERGIDFTPAPPTFGDTLKLVEGEHAGGTSRRLLLDPVENRYSFSAEPPKAGQMELDLEVPKAMEMPHAARGPNEARALETYKELQDAALGKEPQRLADVAPHQVGNTAHYTLKDGSAASGEVVKVLKDGKVMVRDDATGALMSVRPDDADPLMDAIRANQEELATRAGRAQQGGFVSPSVLANMASANVGGLAGYASAEDDASMAEKLSLAGLGALAGLGIKVGATKVLTPAERKFIAEAPPEARSLARPEVRNIAPIAAPPKKTPTITKAKVDTLVSALKDGDVSSLIDASKKADFNFDHLDTSDDVQEMINAFSSVFEKETTLAKHGTQSFDQIEELAKELGAGTESLKELYKGTDNLGARILAHRSLLAASAEKVNSLARLAMTGDSDAILAVRKQVALHATIQAQMKGVQTEVARALSQFRIQASSIDLAVNERNQLIDALGGHTANIRFAQQLADITDPAKLNAVIRKSAMARTKDALFEAWVNGLLSSPVTHTVNALSNSLVAIGSVAERGTASLIGTIFRNADDAIQGGEVKAQLFGMMEGLMDSVRITKQGLDALKSATADAARGDFAAAERTVRDNADEFGNAWQSFASDAPVLDNAAYGTREFDMQSAAFSADKFGLDSGSVVGRMADGLGTLLRTPGRLLTTSDELFKTVHYRGELKAQAYRIARSEALEGDAFVRRIADLVEDPTPELRAQALSAARKGTFTSPLGESGANLQRFIAATPGARFIMPFVRTPTNILKFAGERTPVLNMLSANVRAEFAAGGVRRDMMLAKTTVGGSLYALGAMLAANGTIVGGGEKDQSAEKLGGHLPYSVKVGDTYYAFNRMDPYGMFLGLAADVSDISGQADTAETEDLVSAATLALSRNLVSKSYLSGLINLIEGIANPESKGEKFLQNLAGSTVPMSGLSNAVRKEIDPTVKEVWSMTDAIKSRIPGFSKDVPPQLNVFGEEVLYKGGMGPDIASPVMTSNVETQEAAAEIARLNLDLRPPAKTIGGGSNGAPGIDLSPWQYHRLRQLMGNEAKVGGVGFKDAVTAMIKSEQYKALPEDPHNDRYVEAKEKSIRTLYEGYKRAAVAQLLEEDADLKAKYVQNLKNAGNALTGNPIIPF